MVHMVHGSRLKLGGFGWSSEQSRFALVLEPVTFAIDADDGGVVKDAIEHRGGDTLSPAKAGGLEVAVASALNCKATEV
jgi:hypothetical protein